MAFSIVGLPGVILTIVGFSDMACFVIFTIDFVGFPGMIFSIVGSSGMAFSIEGLSAVVSPV